MPILMVKGVSEWVRLYATYCTSSNIEVTSTCFGHLFWSLSGSTRHTEVMCRTKMLSTSLVNGKTKKTSKNVRMCKRRIVVGQMCTLFECDVCIQIFSLPIGFFLCWVLWLADMWFHCKNTSCVSCERGLVKYLSEGTCHTWILSAVKGAELLKFWMLSILLKMLYCLYLAWQYVFGVAVRIWRDSTYLAWQYVFGVTVRIWRDSTYLAWQFVLGVTVCIWRDSMYLAWQYVFGVTVCILRDSMYLAWQYVFGVTVRIWRDSLYLAW
jgi:hypothetical protein